MKSALLFPGILLQSQGFMFASDKIYTVMIVVLLIWAGILAFLLVSGRKLAKIERELQDLRQGQKTPTGKNG